MRLETEALGVRFQNPFFLAAGTCGFGLELAEVLDIEALGGFVTKSVTLEPRVGNAPPRVAEFKGGMLNSIGLANPGLERTKREKLPWIRDNIFRPRVLISIAGHTVVEFFTLVEGLDSEDGFLGFEINLSCPNDAERTGEPFALNPSAVAEIISGCRIRTERPIVAKLAPNDPDLSRTVQVATEEGANALTLVNTLPRALLDISNGVPELGAGDGGISGPALRPSGLRAVREARGATHLPLFGVGGVMTATTAVEYARAGASLVQMGTASFAWPRAVTEAIAGLIQWGQEQRISAWDDLVSRPPGANAPANRLDLLDPIEPSGEG